jgi:hypothetical protein
MIFWVLACIGPPSNIPRCIQALCTDVTIEINFCWLHGHPFLASRGIKQGRLLSGTIFCIAFDPILRYVLARIPSGLSWLAAFADDVGVAAASIFKTLANGFG